jgi:hypothetical protein
MLAWISSRYECWYQSSFSLTHIETYMNQYQYCQANSWFLISSLFWLDTSDTYFNIYLHTSSFDQINAKWFSKSLFIQANQYREYPIFIIHCLHCHFSFTWHFLIYALLIHSSTLIKASPLSSSSYSCKASHYRDQSKTINSCLICHMPNMLAFIWCYDIPQHRSHFINSICIVVFCLN